MVAAGRDLLDMEQVLSAIHAEGHLVLLTEGGPLMLGSFLAARLLDELFLTLSPVLAGRTLSVNRLGLVAALHMLPSSLVWSELASVRRSDGSADSGMSPAHRVKPAPERASHLRHLRRPSRVAGQQ